MSQITEDHKLAHKAITSVSAILSQVGALSEVIKNDYGEDLLVQTSLDGIADNFTLLIQGKGTRHAMNEEGRIRLSFKIDHLYRWASHGQPVLVCVYCDVDRKIYAFYPREVVSLWELSVSRRKSKSITLNVDSEFSEESAIKFIWHCRIEYYARMLAWHESKMSWMIDGNGFERRRKRINRELNLIAFTFLKESGILVENGELNDKFVRVITNSIRIFLEKRADGLSNVLSPDEAIVLALLGRMDDIAKGLGLPSILIERCSSLITSFFQGSHPEVWRRFEGYLNASAI